MDSDRSCEEDIQLFESALALLQHQHAKVKRDRETLLALRERVYSDTRGLITDLANGSLDIPAPRQIPFTPTLEWVLANPRYPTLAPSSVALPAFRDYPLRPPVNGPDPHTPSAVAAASARIRSRTASPVKPLANGGSPQRQPPPPLPPPPPPLPPGSWLSSSYSPMRSRSQTPVQHHAAPYSPSAPPLPPPLPAPVIGGPMPPLGGLGDESQTAEQLRRARRAAAERIRRSRARDAAALANNNLPSGRLTGAQYLTAPAVSMGRVPDDEMNRNGARHEPEPAAAAATELKRGRGRPKKLKSRRKLDDEEMEGAADHQKQRPRPKVARQRMCNGCADDLESVFYSCNECSVRLCEPCYDERQYFTRAGHEADHTFTRRS